jgi:hypothetical protein
MHKYSIYCTVYVIVRILWRCDYDYIFVDEHLYRNARLWKNQWTRYRLAEDHPIKKRKKQKEYYPWEEVDKKVNSGRLGWNIISMREALLTLSAFD